LIEIWETFLMQLDTEDGETFIPPAGVVAPSSGEEPAAAEHDESQPLPDAGTRQEAENKNDE
jgi:sorting nexin-1/2